MVGCFGSGPERRETECVGEAEGWGLVPDRCSRSRGQRIWVQAEMEGLGHAAIPEPGGVSGVCCPWYCRSRGPSDKFSLPRLSLGTGSFFHTNPPPQTKQAFHLLALAPFQPFSCLPFFLRSSFTQQLFIEHLLCSIHRIQQGTKQTQSLTLGAYFHPCVHSRRENTGGGGEGEAWL